MTTLIVRDATLAVNGAPEQRRPTQQLLVERIAEVRRLPEDSAEQCIEVLHSACGESEDVSQEVLLALSTLCLARPELTEKAGVQAVAVGRRCASRLEQSGDAEGALALIELLRESNPGSRALERDYDAVLRRLGMVTDLADRYFQRAQTLLRQGKSDEAVGWLKEVLQLDRSRKDVARMIRDLRLEELRRLAPRKRWTTGLLVTGLVPVLLCGVVLRERGVERVYRGLPPVEAGDLASLERRLTALDDFLDRYPVWHGTFDALSERTELRIQIAQLNDHQERKAFDAERMSQQNAAKAELLYERARMHVVLKEYDAALEDFQKALDTAPEGWELAERVARDIEAVATVIAEAEAEREGDSKEATE